MQASQKNLDNRIIYLERGNGSFKLMENKGKIKQRLNIWVRSFFIN